jgi:hypothetical protein
MVNHLARLSNKRIYHEGDTAQIGKEVDLQHSTQGFEDLYLIVYLFYFTSIIHA